MTSYVTDCYQNPADGRFYGTVSYGGTVLLEWTTESGAGFKSAEAFEKWARGVAQEHKSTITPLDTHTIKKTFTL